MFGMVTDESLPSVPSGYGRKFSLLSGWLRRELRRMED